jgi:hypothetical protein
MERLSAKHGLRVRVYGEEEDDEDDEKDYADDTPRPASGPGGQMLLGL